MLFCCACSVLSHLDIHSQDLLSWGQFLRSTQTPVLLLHVQGGKEEVFHGWMREALFLLFSILPIILILTFFVWFFEQFFEGWNRPEDHLLSAGDTCFAGLQTNTWLAMKSFEFMVKIQAFPWHSCSHPELDITFLFSFEPAGSWLTLIWVPVFGQLSFILGIWEQLGHE